MGSFYQRDAATVNGITPGATGLALLATATAAEAQAIIGAVGGRLPVLAFTATGIDYALDPDRPSLLARLAMLYPATTIADMEADTQGFTFANTGNGAAAMVATGGLNPGVERGYIRFTPVVAGGYQWNSATRNAYHIGRVYRRLLSLFEPTRDQWWVAGIRIDSGVTIANERNAQFDISDSGDASKVARIAIRYDGGGWKIYHDSTITSGFTGTTVGVANDVVWVAICLPAASRSPTFHYSTAGGTNPPALSTFTQLGGAHTNLLPASTTEPSIGFAADCAGDTSTAFTMDVLYFDDSLARPRPGDFALTQTANGNAAVPTIGCGYSPEQPDLVIAQGICTTGLTQTKLRAILAASENRRDLDTAGWEWKVERNTSDSYSGGSFAAAASTTVSGSGPYLRVTVRPPADGTSPGSLDLVTLRQWSTA